MFTLEKKIDPISSIDELQTFLYDNLLTKTEAAKVTGQSINAFSQAVKYGVIKPFFESEGSTSSKVRLYLKSDLEEYRNRKQK